MRARVFSSGIHRLGACREQDMESWITFSCFGDWESPVLVSEGDDVLLRATRRLLCLADPSRSVGGNTLLAGEQQVSIKKSRIALDSDQISGEMMRKPRSSSSSATYWNGEEPGRLSWPGGRRRRGRTPLPRGRQRRPALPEPCLPCAVALGRTPPRSPGSYILSAGGWQGEDAAEPRVRAPSWALPLHCPHRHGRRHTNRTQREKYRARSSDLDKASSLRREPDATPCRERARFFCRPWPLLCPPPPRSSPRSGRPRPPARAAALLPHRPLRRRRRTPSRRGRRLSSRLAATGGSWC